MKILYVITGLDIGGAETQVMRMVRYIRSNSQDQVQVACLLEPTYRGYVEELAELGIPCVCLGLSAKRTIGQVIINYKKLLGNYKPDVIHAHMFHSNMLVRLLSGNCNARIITTVHGAEHTMGKRGLLYKLTDRRTDYTTCVSSLLTEDFLRAGCATPKKTLCVYNGLDSKEFAYNQAKREEYRRKYQLEENDFVWIIAGRLSTEKNHLNLLEALERLPDTVPNYRLLIAGDGNERARIEDFLDRHESIKQKVLLLGMRHDLPELLSASDAFVLSSDTEGLPLVLEEAAAVGLPMLATDVGGCREVIVEGMTGYLVPAKDSQSMADAMLMMMEQQIDERKQLGENAKKLMQEKFSIERVMEKWYELYRG